MSTAVIIGGGIIGLSTAYYLRKEGWEVTVLDRHEGLEGASYGNAGFIGSSHYTPLANPKAFNNAIKWMLSPTSPFYVHPSPSLSLIDWGLKFMAAATPQHVLNSMRPLAEIGILSQQLYQEWHAEFPTFDYEKKGLIEIYQTQAGYESAAAHTKTAAAFGLEMHPISAAELAALEPDVPFKAYGGVNVVTDAHTYPPKLMRALIARVREMGVKIVKTEATSFTPYGNRIVDLQTKDQPLEADIYVLAAGAWSRELGDSAGIKIPMASGRGYSMTLPHAVCPLRHPIYLGEAAVAVTPMDGDKVRVGGTMEITPMSTPPRMARVHGILNSARRYMPGREFPEPTEENVWYGYRPCSADGVPYIGRSSRMENLLIATGHAMLGFGLGPATGKLITELAIGAKPSMDLAPFSPSRFELSH